MRDLEILEWFLSSRVLKFALGIAPKSLGTGVNTTVTQSKYKVFLFKIGNSTASKCF